MDSLIYNKNHLVVKQLCLIYNLIHISQQFINVNRQHKMFQNNEPRIDWGVGNWHKYNNFKNIDVIYRE